MVSTPRTNTARMCGRKPFLRIRRNSESLTISSSPRRKSRNVFDCDVFLRMPRNAKIDCQCGIEYPSRIIGGATSAVNQFPWMANLKYSNMKKVLCGAVVVSDSHVLTAAHCLSGVNHRKLRVTVAEHNIKTGWETEDTSRRIARVSFHPRHNPSRVNVADIAVITLDHPLPLNHFPVQPVCLPASDGPRFDGEMGTVVGWGTTNADRNDHMYPDELQAVRVPILSNAECQETGYGSIIKNNLLCAGNMTHGGKDACFGDSGGPLTVLQDGRHVLIGLVSFGHSCALPSWPGIYTRVSEYRSWIDSQIATGIQCEL
ncbi:trypsin beta-like [Penaeus japonicus]|uniref:trypsin beta-like n=1 Tax=Penaeus japonicus TaxID=27405 RepID=UPI001C715219|nr:trypsin beta-like [Penaeus japonicus]